MVRFDDRWDDEPAPSDADRAVMTELTELEGRVLQALDRELVLRELVGALVDVLFEAPFHAYALWRSGDEQAGAKLDAWMARRDELFRQANKEQL